MAFNYDDINLETPAGLRRLPIYLLLDCSGSMAGSAIAAVQRGVEQFVQEVTGDTFSQQTVHVGIITFAESAQLITGGIVPIGGVQVPALQAVGRTALGAAMTLLRQSMDRDVRLSVPGGPKGDWKPLVFVLTDGRPTDVWQGPREQLLQRRTDTTRAFTVVTVGCGTDIDTATLKAIAVDPQATFRMDDQDAQFMRFFDWVTASVQQVAELVSTPDPYAATEPLPDPGAFGLVYVP
jgi:uncharacterized protein YegL